ncbi:hypothetical protein WN944_023935 [Citrus x changshan-huyou]|uniref:Transmembrane protein n=1 Tax=Citrus x changshan-huyou TaxID=2935761 RepID=A0AAP0QC38_9ROSI
MDPMFFTTMFAPSFLVSGDSFCRSFGFGSFKAWVVAKLFYLLNGYLLLVLVNAKLKKEKRVVRDDAWDDTLMVKPMV